MFNLDISLSGFLLSVVILSYAIYKNAYINNKLTCNKYILNTYLYIILSLVLVSISVLVVDKFQFVNHIRYGNYMTFFIFLFLTIGSLLLTMYIPSHNTIFKHVSWLSFVILIGLTLFPIYKLTQQSAVLSSTLITTLSIVVILSLVAFYKPELISLSWGPILLILLVSGIIFRIGLMFLSNVKTYNKWSIILSYGFIVLFSFLLLYDTKKIQINSMKCKNPDYINESLGIFLDIINLFSNIGRVNINK